MLIPKKTPLKFTSKQKENLKDPVKAVTLHAAVQLVKKKKPMTGGK
jgi:hypothetical protein